MAMVLDPRWTQADCTVPRTLGPAFILASGRRDTAGFTRYIGPHCVRQARRSLLAWRGSPAASGSGLRGRVLTRPDA